MECPIAQIRDSNRKIIIYGAGNFGGKTFAFLQRNKVDKVNILCFFDSNPVKSDTRVFDVPVEFPSATHLGQNPIVILAHEQRNQVDCMRRVCQKLGYESIEYSRAVGSADSDAWTFTPTRPKPGEAVIVGLVDSCNISCMNCSRRFRTPENIPGNVMSRETFNRILDKAVHIGFDTISFIHWSEPFLHPEVGDFSSDCKARGLNLLLSTNLSLPKIPALIPTLRNCTEFMVSVSGFTQEMHSRNHRGSDISIVKKHLETIAEAKRRHQMSGKLYIKYLDFGYNHEEVEPFRKYAEDLGINFRAMHGIICSPRNTEYNAGTKTFFSQMMDKYSELRKKSLMSHCTRRDLGSIVDYQGDAHLCCSYLSTPFFKVGNFLQDDYALLQALRQTHPYCAICGMEWTDAASIEDSIATGASQVVSARPITKNPG